MVTTLDTQKVRRVGLSTSLALLVAMVGVAGCSQSSKQAAIGSGPTPAVTAAGSTSLARPQAVPSPTGAPCEFPSTAAQLQQSLEGNGIFVEVTLPKPYATPVVTAANGDVTADTEEYDFTQADAVRTFGGTVPPTFGINAPDLGLVAGQQYLLAIYPVPTALAHNGGAEYAASGGLSGVFKVQSGMLSQTCNYGSSALSPGSGVSLTSLGSLLTQAVAAVPAAPAASFTLTPTSK
jgi:hypothetical protein